MWTFEVTAPNAKDFPKEAGFPVGGPNYNRYVMLEVHDNNPNKAVGITDTSGIRFYVTPTLRQYDAGIMELGLKYTNKMAIPPRQKLFQLTGYCISECSSVSIPHHAIHIYASKLHTHLTGKRGFTKHVRQGRELPELNRENHYSHHFQEVRRLPKPEHVLLGGFAISGEMCVNYVHYYPQSDLEVCKSSVSTEALNNFFNFMKKWDRDAIDPHAGDRANYQAIRWTPLTNILLKTLYETSPMAMQCNKSDGSRYRVCFRKVNVNGTHPLKSQSCGYIRCKIKEIQRITSQHVTHLAWGVPDDIFQYG